MRRFLLFVLTLTMLLRSTVGLAMQIDMAYAMKPGTASAATSSTTTPFKALPACHTQAASAALDVSDTTAAPSDCGLCCVAAALPSQLTFYHPPTQHAAPSAVLFNNLPAAAQRPSKPPAI